MEKDWVIAHLKGVRQELLNLIDTFEEEDLNYVPVKGGWSVGEIMLHIGDAAEFWLHSGILSDVNVLEDGRVTLEHFPTISAIKRYLAAEHEMTINLLAQMKPERWNSDVTHHDGYQYPVAWIFWHVL